jgi:alpha-1,6-mannosyltransferase
MSTTLSQSPAFTSDYLMAEARLGGLVGVAPPVRSQLDASLGQPDLIVPALILGGLLAYLAITYAVALVGLSRGAGAARGAVWLVVGAAVAFELTLLFMPGLFSQDVFGYIAYGRIATTYGLNPYVWPPSAFAKDPVVGWVAQVWQTYACPYGPLWVDVQSALAVAAGRLPLMDQAFVYRAVASVLQLLNVCLVWQVLGRVTPLGRTQRVAALAAFAWNPLLLVELVGDAHNDVLMVTLSLLAVLLLVAGQRTARGPLAASVCFTLGALVKYLSGIGVIWAAVAAAGLATSRRNGLLRVASITVFSALVIVVLAVPWLELPDSLDPLLNETVGVGYVNSLPDHLGLALGVQDERTQLLERDVSLVMFGLYLVWEMRRIRARPGPATLVAATARSSLIYVLLVSTSAQAWYFALPVALAVLLGLRSPLARLAIGYSLLALPTFYVSYYLRDLMPTGLWVIYGLVPLAAYLWRPDRLDPWRSVQALCIRVAGVSVRKA